MQRDHGGKRAVAIRLVELGMQGQTVRRDIDRVRRRQWRGDPTWQDHQGTRERG